MQAFSADGTETELLAELPMGPNVKPWDEFAPTLYRLVLNLSADGDAACADSRTLRFGMRSFRAPGTQLAVNGRPTFFRGTVNCAEFPRTGYPATDVDSWRRIFRIAKSYGLNFMRFHSWCPPEAGFAAADQEGFYLLVEGPSWIGDVGKDRKRDLFLEQEALRIVNAFGNHPSFCLMTLGNEAAGDLAVFDRHHNAADTRRSAAFVFRAQRRIPHRRREGRKTRAQSAVPRDRPGQHLPGQVRLPRRIHGRGL